MNPWDLSCRPKLPTDAQQPLFYSASTSQSPASSSSYSSQSTSPASSRSNSIGGSDDIRLGCGSLLTAGASSTTSEQRLSATTAAHEQQASNTTATTNTANTPIRSSQDNHLLADRRARKKDQNRRAAYNYRRKKMEEKNRMREEEMRLVYSRVCLIGYADELESSIMYILNTRTSKILDERGCAMSYLCPICMQSCDSLLNLRSHLNIVHFS